MTAMLMTLMFCLLFVGTASGQTNYCKAATGCTCASPMRATCQRGGMNIIPRFSPVLQVLVINGFYRRHNQLGKIYPTDLSSLSRMKEFYASFCELTDVDENAFQRNILLQKLVLSGNQLVRIRPQTLKPLAMLKILDLTRNLIGSLDPGVFDPLVNLQKLNLGQNQLKVVVPDDFKTLRNLEFLDLHGNQLESIGNDTFKFMMKLKFLDLSGNNLFSFYGMLPPILRMRGTVHLQNNPWRCNCEVKYLQALSPRIINTGLQYSNLRPICAGPPKKANLPVAKAGLLDCSPPRIVKCDPLVQVKEGATAWVNCLVEAEPPAEIEWTTPALKALEAGKLHPRHDIYRNSTFTIDSVTIADDGQYILEAFNKYGTVRYGMNIEVIVPTTTATTTTTTPTTTTTTPTTTTAVPTTTTPTPIVTTVVPSTPTVKIATTPTVPSVAPTLTPGKTPAPPTLKPTPSPSATLAPPTLKPTPLAPAASGGVTPKSSTRWSATTAKQTPSQGPVTGGGTSLAPATQTAIPTTTGNSAGAKNQQGGSGVEEVDTESGPNVGLIAGAAAGGAALLGVIGGVIGFLKLRKKSQAKTDAADNQSGDKQQKPKKKQEEKEEEEEDDMELQERPMPPHAIRLVNPRRSAVPSVSV